MSSSLNFVDEDAGHTRRVPSLSGHPRGYRCRARSRCASELTPGLRASYGQPPIARNLTPIFATSHDFAPAGLCGEEDGLARSFVGGRLGMGGGIVREEQGCAEPCNAGDLPLSGGGMDPRTAIVPRCPPERCGLHRRNADPTPCSPRRPPQRKSVALSGSQTRSPRSAFGS